MMKHNESEKAPESIQFITSITSNNCNLKCKFCDEPQIEKNSIKNNHLISRNGIKIIDQIKNWGILKLTFTGGEPTLVPNIQELLIKSKNCGFKISLATNGVKIVEPIKHFGNLSLLDNLSPYIDVLKLSLHGLGATHDKIVGRKRSFEEVLLCLQKASFLHDNFSTELTCVVTKNNINDISKIVDVCFTYGVSQLTLNEVYSRGRGKEFKQAIPVLKIEEIRNEIFEKKKIQMKEFGLKLAIRPAKASCVLVYPSADVFISHYHLPSGLFFLGNLFKDNMIQKWREFPYREQFLKNYREVNSIKAE